jgi:hypothetical protein
MPHVIAMGGDIARFTGGATEFDVAPGAVRAMLRELDARHPGLGDYIGRRMAIAIDGEIHQDADGAMLGELSEVCLIPKIGGG